MNAPHSLVVSIVPHGSGEGVAAAANAAGAGGGTALLGRGTAASSILQLLGLGDTSKDIVLTLVPSSSEEAVSDAIRASAAEKKPHFGVLFRIAAPKFARSGVPQTGSAEGTPAMQNAPQRELIFVIVNKGYAEDAMAAARKAGAGGGTVLAARGTARPDDAAFFGIPLVPEKDVLLILAEADKAEAVYEAVRTLPCLAENGSGIVFSLPVHAFSQLGR